MDIKWFQSESTSESETESRSQSVKSSVDSSQSSTAGTSGLEVWFFPLAVDDGAEPTEVDAEGWSKSSGLSWRNFWDSALVWQLRKTSEMADTIAGLSELQQLATTVSRMRNMCGISCARFCSFDPDFPWLQKNCHNLAGAKAYIHVRSMVLRGFLPLSGTRRVRALTRHSDDVWHSCHPHPVWRFPLSAAKKKINK